MSSTNFDNFADIYDKVMGDTGDYTHQNTIDPALIKAMGELNGKTIYDIGAGNGYLARMFIKNGAKEVYASDISSNLIKIARERYSNSNKIKYFVKEGNDFTGIPNDYFDLIVMNMVIHFIKDIRKLAQNINNSLKKDSRFVFTVTHPLRKLAFYKYRKITSLDNVLFYAENYIINRKEIVNNIWSGRKDLLIYQRPLSYYINTFANEGLYTDIVIEPQTISVMNDVEDQTEVKTNVPIVCAIGMVKKQF